MAEKSGVIEKTLNINYLKVQKAEIGVTEKTSDLKKGFLKNTANHLKDFKAEQKAVEAQKKAVKAKFKASLDSININHKKHFGDLLEKTKEVEENYVSNLEKVTASKETDEAKLNKAIKEIEKDYLKEVESLLKGYESNIAKSNKEKEQIDAKALSDVENLNKKLQDAKEKHLEKVSSFNEKIAEKIDKLTELSDKKIAKENADILKEEEKNAKSIEDLKPGFDKKLAEVEEKVALEKQQFDTKYVAIKSTLDSKVARHEKFMNKNIKDNDQRAAKQHKKEIAILQKNADKELKILTNEHNEKFKVVNSKRKLLIQENLESIATLTKKLITAREEKLYQIESHKVILSKDVDGIKLETDLKVQEAINKLNEVERDNLVKSSGIVLKQKLDVEQEDDSQVKLKVEFDKQNEINKIKSEQELAIKNKELKLIDSKLELKIKLMELKKAIELSKIENETKVSEKELVLDIKVNEENEIIEYHNIDFVCQSQLSSENLSFQTEIKSLFEGREEVILAYEELELANRASLKVKFLEAQKTRIEADKEVVIAKINGAFETEQILYDEEREKASSKDLEELKIYEEEANDAIKKITDKRNALDTKAYKKEIKDLDNDINDSRNELNAYVHTKRENITSNTVLFDKGIAEVKARRETSIDETKEFFNQELLRINEAIELVISNKDKELKEAKNRHLKTFENTALLLQNAQLRNNLLVEETTAFKMSRIQNENNVVKDFKDIFEKQKFGFKEVQDENLSELEAKIRSEESINKDGLSKDEASYEAKVAEFTRHLQDAENSEASKLEKQSTIHKQNYSTIELNASNKVGNIKLDFVTKENTYKVNISEIDKNISNQSKNFEATKKAVKKDYELTLAKNNSEVNLKLQQDIKAL